MPFLLLTIPIESLLEWWSGGVIEVVEWWSGGVIGVLLHYPSTSLPLYLTTSLLFYQ
jgi:hypothetical protein